MDGTRTRFLTKYLSFKGLTLERHVVGDLRAGKLDDDWMERDPELQDWLVSITVHKKY
jgi:hypothetical protein